AQRNQLRDDLMWVVGVRQGATGRTRAVDPSVLLPIVSSLIESWELPSPNPDDTNIARYVRGLRESLRVDLPEERRLLQVQYQRLRTSLPAGVSASDVADRLLQAGDAAADAAVFSPPDELETYRRDCRLFKGTALSPISHLGELMELDWEMDRHG